jgi:hypothetical protein
MGVQGEPGSEVGERQLPGSTCSGFAVQVDTWIYEFGNWAMESASLALFAG